MKRVRKIIRIDEEKCDGCGLCVPSCAEGAIQIIDGKARVSNEALCDGIGNCLGECPQGAITIEEREADEFDPELVERMMKAEARGIDAPLAGGGCPGSMARSLPGARPSGAAPSSTAAPSALANWPVQLHLVPPSAPYLRGADLLIAADCVGFALPSLHSQLLEGRVLVIGCPKLDDVLAYSEKLTEILALNDVRSITIAIMEVPCCHGLVRLVREAAERADSRATIRVLVVGVDGTLHADRDMPASGGCPADRYQLSVDSKGA